MPQPVWDVEDEEVDDCPGTCGRAGCDRPCEQARWHEHEHACDVRHAARKGA